MSMWSTFSWISWGMKGKEKGSLPSFILCKCFLLTVNTLETQLQAIYCGSDIAHYTVCLTQSYRVIIYKKKWLLYPWSHCCWTYLLRTIHIHTTASDQHPLTYVSWSLSPLCVALCCTHLSCLTNYSNGLWLVTQKQDTNTLTLTNTHSSFIKHAERRSPRGCIS